MKQVWFFAGVLVFWGQSVYCQGVTIGSNNPPDPSAALDIQSVTGGFALPRLSTAQRNAITNPVYGLQVYNTDIDCIETYFALGGWKATNCGCTAFPNAVFQMPGASINTTVTFQAPAPNMTYAWTFQVGTPSSSSAQSVQVVWSSAGKYEVSLSVIDSAGCSSFYADSVTVSTCQPLTYSFTTCGKYGSTGPSQGQCDAAYGSGVVSVTGGIQYWTVPATGAYRIEAAGAQGVNEEVNAGGLGAVIRGEFLLNQGDVLKILVGQTDLTAPSNSSGSRRAGGGGGGSFVVNSSNQPLIVAGGGGGGGAAPYAGSNASATTTANAGNTTGSGAAGVVGNGGGGGQYCGGGAGWNSNGGDATTGGSYSSITGGLTFLNGGTGGVGYFSSASNFGTDGGFGGGGGGWAGAGAGGGYTGGGGGGWSSSAPGAGGGGGSFNAGANQNNQGGVNAGNGYVNITRVCP